MQEDKMLYKEEGDQKSWCTQIQGPWFFLEWFKSPSINYRPLSPESYHKQHYRNWTKQYSGPNNPVNCADISTPCCCVWPGYSDLKKKNKKHTHKKTPHRTTTNNPVLNNMLSPSWCLFCCHTMVVRWYKNLFSTNSDWLSLIWQIFKWRFSAL